MPGILNAELAIPQFPALDQYGPNTTLLLHGDGTNGAQNNTFLDSSANNFTITRNGNTTQGTFSPFSQPNGYWSNYFDGDGDGLTSATSSGFAFGTGDFTIEGWYYSLDSGSSLRGLIDTRASNTSTTGIMLRENSGGFLVVVNNATLFTTGSRVANSWQHVALVRSSGVITLYINGTLANSASSSQNLTDTNCRISGFVDTQASPYGYYGYMSNVRVVKGTAVYTSNFTPPTSPLTAISGTSILTCQSNRFIDNSSNALALTINGTPSVQAFKPFSSPTSYFPAVNGGGGYFDGSGDYLNFTGGSPVTIGTNSATVECWVYPFGISSIQRLVASGTGDFSSGFFILRYNSSNFQAGSGTGNSITAAAPAANQWTHVAWVGSGGTTQTLYVNGVSVGTAGSYNLSSAISAIGGYWTGSGQEYFNGYLSGVRVVNGTAVYTSNFTPPTAPLTAITNTSLLLSCTNAGIIDSVSQNQLETVGNAQVSTTQSKFGGASMYFDGTGDYLTSGSSSPLYDWQGDVTIEAWIYPSSLNGSASQVYGIVGTSAAASDGKTFIYVYGNGKPAVGKNGINEITGSAGNIVTGSWQHLAVVLSGSTTTIYVNGNNVGSGTTSVWSTGSSPIYVAYAASPNLVFNGYIDDLRITKGIARYTQNFTPPQNAYPNYGPLTNIPTVDPNFKNTTLLLHGNGTNGAQNNTFLDSSTNNFTITRNGNTTQGTFTPFSQPNGWWSNYFSGTTDNLKFASNAAFAVGNSNFTIECFVNFSAWASTNQRIFLQGQNGTDNLTIQRDSSANNLLINIQGSLAISYAWTPTIGCWYHIAVVKSGTGSNQLTLYINGVSVANGTSSSSISQNQVFIGGLDWATSYNMQGYISNFRYTVGTALYTGNFTPSTMPLTAVTGTALLTCQSNYFKDNSTNAFAITINGTPSVQNFYPFFPPLDYSTAAIGGSGYFDGSGDYLSVANNTAFNFGSGDFTIETWASFDSLSTNRGIVHLGTDLTSNYSYGVQWASNTLYFWYTTNGSNYASISAAWTPSVNNWYHIAVTRSGNDLKFFINGTQIGSTGSLSGITLYNTTAELRVGGIANSLPGYMSGYLSSFRLVKGTAVYTSNFTPPSTPLTAITNTSLLLSCTNGGIFDNASKNDLETVGNAQISTTQSKFGGSSMSFPGTAGSYLNVPASPNLSFESGDFTIECWAYFNALGAQGSYNPAIISYGGSSWNFDFAVDGNGSIFLYVGVSYIIQSANGQITTGSWIHIALVRSGNNFTIYKNGVSIASATSSSSFSLSGISPKIGAVDASNGAINAYIDDLRITKGVARYRYNFTPPAAPFPNK